MKQLGLIILTALLTAAITVGAYRYTEKRSRGDFGGEETSANLVSNRAQERQVSSTGNPDFVKAAAAVIPAVVHIKTIYSGTSENTSPWEQLFGGSERGRVAMGSGSGVLISSDGYLITNNHVVENASDVTVVLTDKRSFKAKVIGRDPNTDLALVKINGKNFPTVQMGNSDNVQVGEWVLAVGYPFSLKSTVTAGIVSAKGRSIGIIGRDNSDENGTGSAETPRTAIESFIQTDAAINPGNSGGALVNSAGQLVGINSAIASQTGSYEGYGFAIPINLARKIAGDFRKYGEVRRGYLGVSFPAPTAEDQLLEANGVNPAAVRGVYITGVQDGSAAASAGLKEGDIIQSIDGTRVNSSAEFSERIARHNPGDKVELTYLRGNKTNKVDVTLKGQESARFASGNKPSGPALSEKLGAAFSPLPAELKQRYHVSSGVIVTALQEGGFFEQAGIPRGTIITGVNGRRVNSAADIDNALGGARNGMVRIDGVTPDGSAFAFNFPLGA